MSLLLTLSPTAEPSRVNVSFLELVAGGGTANYTLTCDAGSYTLAGQDALLRRTYTLTCDAGAYVLTGQDATLTRGYQLTCDAGAYVLAGQDATLNYVPGAGAVNYTLICDAGAYSLAGQDAILTRGYTLTCDAGAYSLAGQDATLVYTPGSGSIAYTLTCEAGSYSLFGQDASLVYTSGIQPAGKRRVLLDVRGRIHEFDTEEQANAFLLALAPVEDRKLVSKAKRVAKAVVSSGNAFTPQELRPIVVVEGSADLAALANMRFAINQGMLNAAIQREIAAEQARLDDEMAAVALLMMMED